MWGESEYINYDSMLRVLSRVKIIKIKNNFTFGRDKINKWRKKKSFK